MPHICLDEVRLFFMALPFIGVALFSAKHAWHRIWHKGKPKDDGCCDGHDH